MAGFRATYRAHLAGSGGCKTKYHGILKAAPGFGAPATTAGRPHLLNATFAFRSLQTLLGTHYTGFCCKGERLSVQH